MVKFILFRVFLRKSFVCDEAFTSNALVFLRATHACLCEGLRAEATGVSSLGRRGCSDYGSGGILDAET